MQARRTRSFLLAACAAVFACGRADTEAITWPIAEAHQFVVTTTQGDTLAVEQVREGQTWWESTLRLPARGELQRIVLQVDSLGRPLRWDVSTQSLTTNGAPDETRAVTRWRVLATADSLYVAEGAPIGVSVRVYAVSSASDVQPWHRESPAMLEQLVRIWRHNPQAPQRVLTWPTHVVSAAPRVRTVHADSVLVSHPAGDWRLRVDSAGLVLGGTSPSRGLLLHRVETTTFADRASETPPNVVEARLTATDGVTLAGAFSRPAEAVRGPVAILVSGSGPQDRDLAVPGLAGYRLFGTLADSLTGRGLAVLRLDDRGAGASGGAAFASPAAQNVRDLQSAIDWVYARQDWTADGLVLIAHSDGALAALDVADRQPLGRVRAVVLLGAPARSGRDLARAQRAQYVRADPIEYPVADRAVLLRRLERETERLAAVDQWLRDWLEADPRTHRWRFAAPVLLVHGARDQQVPVSQAHELAAHLREGGLPSVRVLNIPGVNHLLLTDASGDPRGYRTLPSRVVQPAVLRPILDWLTTLPNAPDTSPTPPEFGP